MNTYLTTMNEVKSSGYNPITGKYESVPRRTSVEVTESRERNDDKRNNRYHLGRDSLR